VNFYLGTHRPWWLWLETPPLCVPRQQLEDRKLSNLDPAVGRWFLDSGGFTELTKHGRWTWSAERYAELVVQLRIRIGGLDWVAPQDWMCEPHMIARTGLSVREHQERTVANGLRLRELLPTLPVRYVLQGYTIAEYLQCVELYRSAGIDLADEPLVGVGSVCRRQNTDEIAEVFRVLHGLGLKMHGFGVKSGGFRKYARYLASADSLAWSYRARRHGEPMPGCEGRGHINCANCLRYAAHWYHERVREIADHTEVAA
jgi:hypothetical protein